jgi:hypothetical protein
VALVPLVSLFFSTTIRLISVPASPSDKLRSLEGTFVTTVFIDAGWLPKLDEEILGWRRNS